MPRSHSQGCRGCRGCRNSEPALPAKPLLRGAQPQAIPGDGGRKSDKDPGNRTQAHARLVPQWAERGPPPGPPCGAVCLSWLSGRLRAPAGQAMRPGSPRRTGLVTTHRSGDTVTGKGLILPRGGNHVVFLELRRDSRATTGISANRKRSTSRWYLVTLLI